MDWAESLQPIRLVIPVYTGYFHFGRNSLQNIGNMLHDFDSCGEMMYPDRGLLYGDCIDDCDFYCSPRKINQ